MLYCCIAVLPVGSCETVLMRDAEMVCDDDGVMMMMMMIVITSENRTTGLST